VTLENKQILHAELLVFVPTQPEAVLQSVLGSKSG
jgi:hypothetical protein